MGSSIFALLKMVPAAKKEMTDNVQFAKDKTTRRLAEEADRRDIIGYDITNLIDLNDFR